MTFEEFDKQIRRVNDKRNTYLPTGYTMRSAYRWYRKAHKDGMTEKLYDAVIKAVNIRVAEKLYRGEKFKIPHRMGYMELRKVNHRLVRKNGRIVTLINWPATHKLWYDDEEARERKALIRYEESISYRIYYNKFQCNCDNIKFYDLHVIRPLRKKIRRGMEEGDIVDALELF